MRDRLSKSETESIQELLEKCGSGPQIIINNEAAELFEDIIHNCDCITCQFLAKCLMDMRDIH